MFRFLAASELIGSDAAIFFSESSTTAEFAALLKYNRHPNQAFT